MDGKWLVPLMLYVTFRFLFIEEVRATNIQLREVEKVAADTEKAKRRAEAEREEAYNALDVGVATFSNFSGNHTIISART